MKVKYNVSKPVGTPKAVFHFVVLNTYIRNGKKSQFNNWSLYLNKLGKKSKINSEQKSFSFTKIRKEINETANRNIMKKIQWTEPIVNSLKNV